MKPWRKLDSDPPQPAVHWVARVAEPALCFLGLWAAWNGWSAPHAPYLWDLAAGHPQWGWDSPGWWHDPVTGTTIVLLSVLWVRRRHDAAICPQCASVFLRDPLPPAATAEKLQWRFRLLHSLPPSRRGRLTFSALLLASALATPQGWPAALEGAANCALAALLLMITRSHDAYQPWCPWCDHGGRGNDAPKPDPVPGRALQSARW